MRAYLDNAATPRLHPEVREAIDEVPFGNPYALIDRTMTPFRSSCSNTSSALRSTSIRKKHNIYFIFDFRTSPIGPTLLVTDKV